eukprot:TRINITY_DN1625_c0_g1_i5.p1 TRINITY_DN1625_c0_g1~~TRINITY_DN1625_c0_g1_i5.p1  ORF type:complete len:482 (-),score=181.11 TRINITY_DN1625_c0_g1_i5:153-1598(-)
MIGEGSYGQVFSGFCRGKNVAIKVFKPDMFQTEEERQAIREEVKIMSKIYHPNVVLFMGACTLEGNNVMIVTEKMPADLETLLISEHKKKFSLYARIKMAKDAALGMNWLHRSNPIFIHRDLKLSNLLVDNSHRVCVCDFGLAQMKPRDVANLEYDPHGSPLYMAPEVFVGDYNEKCDIYSFGVVLWEIYTQSQAFAQVSDNLPAFIQAVCDHNFRPEIPSDCPEPLSLLMLDCWQKNPRARPSFEAIIPRLDQIAIDVTISDRLGRRLWTEFFMGRDETPWEDFKLALCDTLQLASPSLYELAFRCMEAVLAESPKDLMCKDQVVNIEKWASLCSWFGPLSSPEEPHNLLKTLEKTLKQRWFHGDISQDEAEDRLLNQPKGTFLVRFSSSAPGCFTISHINKSKALTHQRVTHVPGEGFHFWDEVYPSLKVLIREQRKKQFFVQPCPGSRFLKFFPKKRSSSSKTPPPTPGGAYLVAPKK